MSNFLKNKDNLFLSKALCNNPKTQGLVINIVAVFS